MDKSKQIRAYIVESFLLGDGDGFSDGESLLESGTVDSTGVMELVAFIEETFGVDVDDEDLVPENLDTISDIAAFVERKLGVLAGQVDAEGRHENTRA